MTKSKRKRRRCRLWENGLAAFGGSPNNKVLVFCGVEELVADMLAVVGSNKDFAVGAASGFFSITSPVGLSENGKLVVTDGFSGTADGFPNANRRLEVPLLLVIAVAFVVKPDLSSMVLPNENGDSAGFCSSAVFPNKQRSETGLLSTR
jgi:hypothetical protein